MTAWSPERWAFTLTHLLNTAQGAERFPIDVVSLAREYSAQRFPKDPITLIHGDDLPNFDGALFRAPKGQKGWGIIYNSRISSKGRINFTLAHEFGHYLLHRLQFPDGLRCGEQDLVRWDSQYQQVEQQANEFAANLLMPLDDFRRQIDPRSKVDLDMIAHCADRYRVSLIAATLRWLKYTERRAVLVVSREGYMLWAWSSDPAWKSGAFFRTANRVVPVPGQSLAARQDLLEDGRGSLDLPAGVWFPEPVREMSIFAEHYDFTISLLLLETGPARIEEDQPIEDVYARMMSRQ